MRIVSKSGFRIKFDSDDGRWNYLGKNIISDPIYAALHKGIDVDFIRKDDSGFIVDLRISDVKPNVNSIKLCVCGHRKGIHSNNGGVRTKCCLSSCSCLRFVCY